MVIAGRCSFSLGELKYEYPQEIVPRGRDAGRRGCASSPTPACRSAFPTALPEAQRPAIETSSRVIAELRVRGLLPHRRRHRRAGRARRTSCARAAAAPPTRWSATACDVTEVDPRRADAAVRPLHQRRAQRAARHRHRLRAPAPRGGDPVHLRQVRPPPRRAHRRRHQLPAALGAARRRPRARHRPAAHRRGLEEPALVRRPRHRARAAARERLRSRGAGRQALDGADGAADLRSRATSRSTRAASSSPRAAWPSWCRSRTRP